MAAPNISSALPQHLTLTYMTTAAFKVKLKTYARRFTINTKKLLISCLIHVILSTHVRHGVEDFRQNEVQNAP